jgi:hypothetical protein
VQCHLQVVLPLSCKPFSSLTSLLHRTLRVLLLFTHDGSAVLSSQFTNRAARTSHGHCFKHLSEAF